MFDGKTKFDIIISVGVIVTSMHYFLIK